MIAFSPEQVRDLLRQVPYPGFSRDIVSAGFVKDIDINGPSVVVHFTPNSTNTGKIEQMESGIHDVLERAEIEHVRITTSLPFDEDDMALRKPITTEDDSDYTIDRALTGDGAMNPLQAELREDGIVPEVDVLRADMSGAAPGPGVGVNDPGVGFGEGEPQPFEGPSGPPGKDYDGALPVFQWEIDPHDSSAESVETVRRQRPWDRLGGLNKRGFLAHLNPRGIGDETEHQSPESIGREGREGHPAGDSSAVRRRREDPDRSGGPVRRGQYR